MPNITLPDGSVRSFEAAVSGSEVAASIGRKLEKDAVAIRVNGELRDLTTTLESDASVEIITRTSANLHSRTSTQPYQQPSCGSVFRNPEPLKAGRLIEALGLKGLSIGGAQISPIHANFIVNTGAAQAWEIKNLIELVQEKVRTAHGIELHPEVMRLGF